MKAMSGEDFERRNSPQITPVVAIRRPYKGSVIVAEDSSDGHVRAVGENDVVFG